MKPSEDVFFKACDDLFSRDVDLDIEIFDPENFEGGTKDIGSGAWVKVPTTIGYNVYYAKPISPKYDIYSLQRKIDRLSLQTDENSTAEELRKGLDKMERIMEKWRFAVLCEELGQKPYYIQIKVARNKYQYLLPNQYELASSVELYQNVILAHGKGMGVAYKSLYRSNDEDIIHYIMSRGIERDEAIMMAKLKEIYFVCDVQMMMHKVFQPVSA